MVRIVAVAVLVACLAGCGSNGASIKALEQRIGELEKQVADHHGAIASHNRTMNSILDQDAKDIAHERAKLDADIQKAQGQ